MRKRVADSNILAEGWQKLDSSRSRSFSFHRSEQIQFARGGALKVLLKHPVVTGASMAFRRQYFDLLTPIPAKQIHDRWISFLLATRVLAPN